MGSVMLGPVDKLGYPFTQLNHDAVRLIGIEGHDVYAFGKPFLYSDYDIEPVQPLDAIVVWDPGWLQNGRCGRSRDELSKLREMARKHEVPLIGILCDWFAAWDGLCCWGTPLGIPLMDGFVIDPVGAATLRTIPIFKNMKRSDQDFRPIVPLRNYLSYGRLPTLGADEDLVADVQKMWPIRERPMDVCFVGHPHQSAVIHRAYFTEQLIEACDRYGFSHEVGFGYSAEKMERLLVRSKVCFNTSAGSALNMRVFEAAAAGCNLLTDRHNQGNEDIAHFADFYANAEEIRDGIWHMLQDSRRLERQSISASRWAVKNSPTTVWKRVIDSALTAAYLAGDAWRDRTSLVYPVLTKADVRKMRVELV